MIAILTSKKFLLPICSAFLLLASWSFSQTSYIWNALDNAIYSYLNTWIQSQRLWQNFWAIMSHSSMDWVNDVIMILFFAIGFKKTYNKDRFHIISEIIFSAIFITLTILCVNYFIFSKILSYQRMSPTVFFENSFKLSQCVSWIQVKDRSFVCFPGDHGTLIMLFVCIIYYLRGLKQGLFASIYAAFFCLPRLIAGAHWLTDIIVGSCSISLLATGLAFGTPCANMCISKVKIIIEYIWSKIDDQLPGKIRNP